MIISSKRKKLQEKLKTLEHNKKVTKTSYLDKEISNIAFSLDRHKKYTEENALYYDNSKKGMIRTGKNIFKEG